MALTKKIETQVTVLSDGQMQVLDITKIMEDSKELSRANHRRVIVPGDDLTAETGLVKEIGDVVHTKERIDDYEAKQEELI